jgi:myosin heavy subunit
LLESSGGSVVVRLAAADTTQEQDVTATPGGVRQGPPQQQQTISLSANALKDGQVVLCNDYEVDDVTGMILPPHDLITLTHLHEPAVVESLQNRYQNDLIYTNTGPVLLALNPFQNVRGLYGEAIMKKYWDAAEKPSEKGGAELPPHVYAIADESFRSMMRGLEDQLLKSGDDTDCNASSSSTGSNSARQCNQSILVSGESGAGKTVTAKFIMKYLAALSQRSAVLQAPAQRAFLAVEEQRMQDEESAKWNNGVSPRHSSTKAKPSQPSWAVKSSAASASKAQTASNNDSASSLSSVTVLKGTKSNSIEAQVLQSNPILESFGNARTVRNDNSSRFGKFIEIQFTATGKLVGACVDTYLLEKVRLVTQSAGERNYHIFFELLSGAMDSRELSQYYLAPTARPTDFCMTAAGTYDRRDGVTDKDTYRQLRLAMNTMKFSVGEQKQVFSVVAAILHSSNLTFQDLPAEESALNESNVHLLPVCHLLGVPPEYLNQALCYFSITAGNQTIERSLTRQKAEKGLEALLKATYGALFSYLVKRINDSISFKEHQRAHHSDDEEEDDDDDDDAVKSVKMNPLNRPAASIGVLDIFGFESFTTNSFEQLCINYCNEALQQQFNAFVLKNEQAEYEREGIEWSFIEFPENQDVLDLIEKRGTGILSILDDQCRAPGPSDRAFAQNVYNNCKGTTRLTVSRKQRATNQFSVHHYAGPVEYTTEGFTEKNRDELPKEMTELLKHSEIPFIRELAEIMETSHDVSSDAKVGGTPTPKKLSRMDSSIGRATVGGQFRRQLRELRVKIDATSPHYVRCLKPNDNLVPDHFDTAIVAEQLRCGGILEAVRVARAGFTQHYPHSDFVRRYRTLAWRELNKKDNFRNRSTKPNDQSSSDDPKVLCKDLIKVLYRKLQQLEREDVNDGQDSVDDPSSPSARATQYSPRSGDSSNPSWTKGTRKGTVSKTNGGGSLPPAPFSSSDPLSKRYTPWENKTEPKKEVVMPPPGGSWNRRGVTASDYAKVGIQMGKTKVFLRHKAFEALERIRSREQSQAATSLNAMFRMYLARMAYLPYRNAFRCEIRDRRHQFEEHEFKECKDQDYGDDLGATGYNFQNSRSFYRGGGAEDNMVDKWIESQVRDAIHNPVCRSQWGKQTLTGDFQWVISEGLWVKNHY